MDSSLNDLVPSFANQRILVVGDVMLDEYIWGEVRRISPEGPVPVVEMRRRSYMAGGASNTAVNVISLGGTAVLGGVVGRDHSASALREKLVETGADVTGLVVDKDRVTTTKTRIIAHSQQVTRVDSEARTPLSAELENELLDWAAGQMPTAHACVISDYAKGVITPRFAEQFLSLARQAGKPVIVDPKGTNYSKYRGATVVKPNVHEAERFCKLEISSEAQLWEASRQLLRTLPGSALLVTRGPEGMSLFVDDAAPYHVSSVARDVFDVTGAGDTVASVLALALAVGATIHQAAVLANFAAGVVVAKVGTSTASQAELLGALARRSS